MFWVPVATLITTIFVAIIVAGMTVFKMTNFDLKFHAENKNKHENEQSKISQTFERLPEKLTEMCNANVSRVNKKKKSEILM